MKITRIAALALLLVSPCLARVRVYGWCEAGGSTVNVSVAGGIYIGATATPVQKSFPGCTVTVYQVGTTTPIVLYSDNAGTALTNPFVANQIGYWFFYADNGRYDVKFSGAGIGVPYTLGDVIAADPIAPTAPGTVSWLTQVTSKPFIDIRAYGVSGNGIQSQGGMVSGNNVLTDTKANFTNADAGKPIYVKGAGLGGISGVDLYTTIAARLTSTTVQLAANATTTVVGAFYGYGTDDAAAIRSALTDLAAQGGGELRFPAPGTFFLNSTGPTYFGDTFSFDITSSNITITMAEGARFLEGCDCGVFSVNYGVRNQWTEVAGGLSGCTVSCAVVYGITPLPAAGATTVTLSNPTNTANFKVGDFILIRTGYVLLTNINQDIPDAEINQVTAINASTGAITLRWHTIKPYQAENYPADGSFGAFAGTPTPFGITNVNPIIVQNIQFNNFQLITDQDRPALEGGEVFGFFMYGGSARTVAMFQAFNFSRWERIEDMNIFMDPLRSRRASVNPQFTNSYWLSVATGTADAIFKHNTLESTGNSYVHVHEGASLKLLYNTIKPKADTNAAIQTTVSIRARNYETEVIGNTIYGEYAWNVYVDPTCVAGGVITDNIILNTSVAGGGQVMNIAGLGGWTVNNNTGASLLNGISTVGSTGTNFGTSGPLLFMDTNGGFLKDTNLNWTTGFLGVGNPTPATKLDVLYNLGTASSFGGILSNSNTTAGINSGMVLRTANLGQNVGISLQHGVTPYWYLGSFLGSFGVVDLVRGRNMLASDSVGNTLNGGGFYSGVATFSGLTVGNYPLNTTTGNIIVSCSNCDTPASPGATCTSSGDQVGAEAHRIRNVWKCF